MVVLAVSSRKAVVSGSKGTCSRRGASTAPPALHTHSAVVVLAGSGVPPSLSTQTHGSGRTGRRGCSRRVRCDGQPLPRTVPSRSLSRVLGVPSIGRCDYTAVVCIINHGGRDCDGQPLPRIAPSRKLFHLENPPQPRPFPQAARTHTHADVIIRQYGTRPKGRDHRRCDQRGDVIKEGT